MKNTNSQDENERNPGRKAYYQHIKERLIKHEQELNAQGFQLIYSQLADNIQKRYNIETSDQKIRAIFSTSNNREIPLAEMVALCHMLHIPIFDITDFPDAPMAEIDPPWLKNTNSGTSSGLRELSNPFYLGTYYCYYFSRKYLDNTLLAGKSQAEISKIRSAKLIIEEENGITVAHYKELYYEEDFYKQKSMEQLEFKGRVYLFDKPNHVYSLLIDSHGKRVFSLLFNYQDYIKDIMYYRTAAMTTISGTPSFGSPLLQKMALFRVEQDLTNPEIEKAIRGILTFNSNNILIEKGKFEQMMEDDPDLSKINSSLESYYYFNETDILNQKLPWTYNEKINKILNLRQASTSPAQQLVSDDKNFARYAKNLQQSQL